MEETSQELAWLDRVTRFMDNRFRIPGTDIRFGLDFLVGLIPGVGDIVSLSISALLVAVMARKGASGMVVVKMIGNIIFDAIVGAVPVLGDLFDLGYKANRRNLHLLQEHYREGAHQGSAWPVVIAILVLLLVLIVAISYAIWWVLRTSWGLMVGA
ncbi:MAG: DUF4112 domain-containing protein [Bacteroidetes bacterium]|nr:MAG: DUF4112 domain-containing protein [Bacteroidota bacterium]